MLPTRRRVASRHRCGFSRPRDGSKARTVDRSELPVLASSSNARPRLDLRAIAQPRLSHES
jgi:hypothetical protein